MIQKIIRAFNDQTFTPEEAAEWLQELVDRTQSSQVGYNSINELATLLKNAETLIAQLRNGEVGKVLENADDILALEAAVLALQNGEAGEAFLNRAAATAAWDDRTANTTQPQDGVTIYLVTEKEFHEWDSTDATHRTSFVRDYIDVTDELPTVGSPNIIPSGKIAEGINVVSDKIDEIVTGSLEQVASFSNFIIDAAGDLAYLSTDYKVHVYKLNGLPNVYINASVAQEGTSIMMYGFYTDVFTSADGDAEAKFISGETAEDSNRTIEAVQSVPAGALYVAVTSLEAYAKTRAYTYVLPDELPTIGSNKVISSGKIAEGLALKQDKLDIYYSEDGFFIIHDGDFNIGFIISPTGETNFKPSTQLIDFLNSTLSFLKTYVSTITEEGTSVVNEEAVRKYTEQANAVGTQIEIDEDGNFIIKDGSNNIGFIVSPAGETNFKPSQDLIDYLNENLTFPSNLTDEYEENIGVVLPSKLYFVKDEELCIYKENITRKQLNDAVDIVSNKGNKYSRLFNLNFSSAATNQTLTTQIIRKLKKAQLKTMTYDVIDATVNDGKSLDVLFIGDSFTDLGWYIKRAVEKLVAAGVTVNQIGNCGRNATGRHEGLSGGKLQNVFLDNSTGVARIVDVTGMTQLPATYYPGTWYSDANGDEWDVRGGNIDGNGDGKLLVTKYGAVESDFSNFPTSGTLTKVLAAREGDASVTYSNATPAYFNPFINPSTDLLDLPNYLATWGYATPQVICIQFTWNDLTTWNDDTYIQDVVDGFVTATTHIHANYPNTQIIFSIEPYGAINGDIDWHGKKFSVLRFVELMLSTFENSTYENYVTITPSYACVDLINGYSTAQEQPSQVYSNTENGSGDNVHPNASTGMLEIGDCVYATIQEALTRII